MSGIFISYRRDDTAPYARLLSESLATRFGRDTIYRDLDSMTPGVDFPKAVATAVGTCDVLLAVIGPDWPGLRPDGSRRLDDPGDYVHIEVASALNRDDVLVVPLLIEGTPMPGRAELPGPLAGLADRNAHRLADEGWSDDVRRLMDALEQVVTATGPGQPPRSGPVKLLRRPAVVAAVVLVVAMAIGLAATFWPDGNEPGATTRIVVDTGSGMLVDPDDLKALNEFLGLEETAPTPSTLVSEETRTRTVECGFGEVTIEVGPTARIGEYGVSVGVSLKAPSAAITVPGRGGVRAFSGASELTTIPSDWPSSPTELLADKKFLAVVVMTTAELTAPASGSEVRIELAVEAAQGSPCAVASAPITVP